jgi:hypothetical protein
MTSKRKKRIALLAFGLLTLTVGVLGWIDYQRREYHSMMAEHHLAEMAAFDLASRSEGDLAEMVEGKKPRSMVLSFMAPVENTKQIRARQSLDLDRANFHGDLSRKHQEAVDHPWASAAPAPSSR